MKELWKLNLDEQQHELLKILKTNASLQKVLYKIDFAENLEWYLLGGCVYQTVWNFLTNRDPEYGIGDYDIHYWDPDLSEDKEKRIQEMISNQISDSSIQIEAVNQARVHEWFEGFFGRSIPPFVSLQQEITLFPVTGLSVGVSIENGKQKIYAPHGLTDLFTMTLRYNPETFIPLKFELEKNKKRLLKWPELKILKNSYPSL